MQRGLRDPNRDLVAKNNWQVHFALGYIFLFKFLIKLYDTNAYVMSSDAERGGGGKGAAAPLNSIILFDNQSKQKSSWHGNFNGQRGTITLLQ